MARSASGVRVSVSLVALHDALPILTPAGGLTVAVLVNVPVAAGSTWTVKLKVTVALTGRSAGGAKGPVPPLGPVTVPPPLLAVVTPGGGGTPARRGAETPGPGAAHGAAVGA